MDTKKWQTSVEEIANIIFNSTDAELNDILFSIVEAGRYEIAQLFIQMTLSINSAFPYHLRSDVASSFERQMFLQEKIKLELTYYAIHAELVK